GDEVEHGLLLLVDLQFAQVLLPAQGAIPGQRLPRQCRLPRADRQLVAELSEFALQRRALPAEAGLAGIEQFAVRGGGGQHAAAATLDAFGDVLAGVATALGGARRNDQRQRYPCEDTFPLSGKEA